MSTDRTPAPTVLIAGTLIVLATIVAWLWGEAHQVNTSALLSFVTPVVAALLIVEHVKRANAEQSEKIDAVQASADQAVHQTNGQLTARIEEAVTRIVSQLLDERGLTGEPAGDTLSTEHAPTSAI